MVHLGSFHLGCVRIHPASAAVAYREVELCGYDYHLKQKKTRKLSVLDGQLHCQQCYSTIQTTQSLLKIFLKIIICNNTCIFYEETMRFLLAIETQRDLWGLIGFV